MDIFQKLQTHKDERGILTEILKRNQTDYDIQHVYFSTSKPNAVRGNHYHKQKVEWFSVVKGKGEIALIDNNTNLKKRFILNGNEPSLLMVSPEISHAIKNIGNDDMLLIIIANIVYDPNNSDTYFRRVL